MRYGCLSDRFSSEAGGLSGRGRWHGDCKRDWHTSPPGIVTAISVPARLVSTPHALVYRLGALSAALLGVALF